MYGLVDSGAASSAAIPRHCSTGARDLHEEVMVFGRAPRHALRVIRAESARIVALALGLVMLVGLVRGGSHYRYCPFMDAVVDERCCAEMHDDASSVRAPDCCETKTIGTLPSSAGVLPVPAVAPASIVAVLPAAPDVGDRATAARDSSWTMRLTGPPALGSAQRMARLQVFLI